MKPIALLGMALALSLSACADLPMIGAQEPGTAQLVLTPQVIDGGLRTQAVVDNYTRSSINHLVVKIFRINGGTETPVLDANDQAVVKDIPEASLDASITIDHLNANTTYRVRSYAYKNAGTDLADLISTSDATSYVDVTLTNDDRPTMAQLRVKLVDVAFNGSASSGGVAVTEGGYSSSGSVTIQ